MRDDLYYRLNGAQYQLPATPALSPAAMALLRAHDWPGNLRELRNVIQYSVAVCSDGCIEPGDLPDELPGRRKAGTQADRGEADELLQVLRACRWNVSAAAQQLGLARMTLYRRMKRFNIVAPNERDGAP